MFETLSQHNALHDRVPLSVAGMVEVTVAPERWRFSLRVGEADRPAMSSALGIALPSRVGASVQGRGLSALCLGPDEWCLLGDDEAGASVEDALRGLAVAYSLVDVSHRELGIDLRGPLACDVLSAICARDLAGIERGEGTRTILDRAPVVLFRQAQEHWRVEVWQSFAPHVWGLLAAIVQEYRIGM